MVGHEFMELAKLWVAACKKAKVVSGEIYWSDKYDDTEFVITIWDREMNLHQVYGNSGSDE